MTNTEEILALAQKLARLSHDLVQEQAVGTDADALRKQRDAIKEVFSEWSFAQLHLQLALARIEAGLLERWTMRPKLYVVRREAERADQPLTWGELAGAEGPWVGENYYHLEVAFRNCERKNEKERAPGPPRSGHRPGAYVHQVWEYRPEDDNWHKIEETGQHAPTGP